MPGEHLTNLESDQMIASALAQAESNVMAVPDDPIANANLRVAKARADGHKATMQLLEQEFGPLHIGKPAKTRMKSSELLASQGYVGIYRNA